MGRDTATRADAYDRWFEEPWGRYAFAIEAQSLGEGMGPVDGDLVLDAGCGTGRFALELARAGGGVVGLDIDRSMLVVAARRLSVPFVVADVGDLPFGDGAFDAAVAITVLEFVPDPDRAFAELVRVTRPGGRVVVGALNPRSFWGMIHRRRGEPWAGARFLSPSDLASLGARYGDDVAVSGALWAPGPIPGLRRVGPVLERVGRRFPRWGAFQVLVVRRR
ncbi:MAG: class I SAM-dependent methyltransferase [Acidimicrobiia bacterium]|nr:class I SAM-dependent methyltransferase [Acidimicrobiia bacterium]